MRQWLLQLARADHGQDLIEYALLTGFISLVSVAIITSVGTGVNNVYGNIAGVFTTGSGSGTPTCCD